MPSSHVAWWQAAWCCILLATNMYAGGSMGPRAATESDSVWPTGQLLPQPPQLQSFPLHCNQVS